MSHHKRLPIFLAGIGIVVLLIVRLSSTPSYNLLNADDVESSPTNATDPADKLPVSRSDTTVILGTSDVEIAFAVDVPNYHVGIEHLKDFTGSDTITISFDESKHLWTIAVLDTAGTMTAENNLHDISFDDASIDCDTLKYTFKNNYPTGGDVSYLFN